MNRVTSDFTFVVDDVWIVDQNGDIECFEPFSNGLFPSPSLSPSHSLSFHLSFPFLTQQLLSEIEQHLKFLILVLDIDDD